MEKVIVDCSTGEQTVVPLTDEEIAELEAAAAKAEADRLAAEQEAAAKAVARQALLGGQPRLEPLLLPVQQFLLQSKGQQFALPLSSLRLLFPLLSPYEFFMPYR